MLTKSCKYWYPEDALINSPAPPRSFSADPGGVLPGVIFQGPRPILTQFAVLISGPFSQEKLNKILNFLM
jgi:hypothetical protein